MEQTVDLERCSRLITAIRQNVARVLIGQEQSLSLVLTGMIAGGHVLLEDVPGTGKTVMAKSIAKSIAADFARIQFTPDLLPSDVTGLNYYHQESGEFRFRKGPVFCNILLADEINRATPRTQSALLECMEEHQITIDGVTHRLSEPFFVIATENPIETAGTFPLPEAQLDRFMLKLSLGMPTPTQEIAIMERFMTDQPLETLDAVCSGEDICYLNEVFHYVYVHPTILSYIADLVSATRQEASLISGVSPRGTLNLLRACQAYALISGRDYVVPEDVKELAIPVLAHRIVTNRGFGRTDSAANIISTLLTRIAIETEDWSRK